MPERTEQLGVVTGDLAGLRVGPEDTVSSALGRIRQNGIGVVVVVDGSDRILGTLTDGSIRRAALRNDVLDAEVRAIMDGCPVTVTTGTPDTDVVELLRRHRLRAVPVVEAGELVGLRFLQGRPAGSPRTAVIMAGGRGSRLGRVTEKVPKPLLKVGPRSIVERLITSLAAAGVEEVFLAVNYLAEVFEQRLGSGEQLGVTLRYLREEDAMGTAGALSLLPPADRGAILVVNGDIVTTVDFTELFDFHRRYGAAITVAGIEYRSPIPYGVLRNVEHHLLAIEEKPERRDFCSAGIYVLEPEVLGFLPPKEALGMPELIADVIAEGRAVHVFPILEAWYDIGETAQLERVLVRFATGDED